MLRYGTCVSTVIVHALGLFRSGSGEISPVPEDIKGVAREQQRRRTFGSAAEAVVLSRSARLETCATRGEILESTPRGKRQMPRGCNTR